MPRHPPCALLSLTNWSSLTLESLLGFSLAKFIVVLADLPCLFLYFAFCFLFFIQFSRYSSQPLLNPIPRPLPDVSIFLQRGSPPAQLVVGRRFSAFASNRPQFVAFAPNMPWLLPFQEVVGSSGLEPPTSRLSGVRSNHLSYEPMSARTPVSCLRPARFPGSFRGSLDSQVSTVSSFSPSFTSCRGAAAFRQPFQTTR